jgi:sporulation protein YlmC with PRC-barrel domain
MNTLHRIPVKLSLALGGMLLASFAVAQNPGQNAGQQEYEQRRQQAVERRDSQASQLDDKVPGSAVRASKLIGMNIQNPQGKELGEVEDIVLDLGSGKVRYAAVTYGGFLGLGDKLFAVPFEAFQVTTSADDADEIVLVLDIKQQQLEGAQGFDQDNWPDFADRKFQQDLAKRYKIEQR